ISDGSAAAIYYSAAWQVLEERNSSGSTLQTYAWSPVYIDAMIARDQSGTRLYVQQDANWNVTALLSSGGSVVQRMVEDPYGTVTFLTASWGSGSNSNSWVYLHQGGRLDG